MLGRVNFVGFGEVVRWCYGVGQGQFGWDKMVSGSNWTRESEVGQNDPLGGFTNSGGWGKARRILIPVFIQLLLATGPLPPATTSTLIQPAGATTPTLIQFLIQSRTRSLV